MPVTSESVWFEQVERALITFIQSIVPSPLGEDKLLPVSVRKPDEDFKIETYPSVTLYNLYFKPDEFRRFRDLVVVDRDFEAGLVYMEDAAVPFNLYYQFDFWATKQLHMNEMTRLWFGNIRNRWFNLDVVDQSGVNRNVFVLQQGDVKKSDLLEGSNRIYHTIMTYRVYVELDEPHIQVVHPMVEL